MYRLRYSVPMTVTNSDLPTDEQVKAAFGSEVRSARARMFIGQVEAARRIGISRATLSKIEHGQTCPSIAVAVRVATVLNISLDTLL